MRRDDRRAASTCASNPDWNLDREAIERRLGEGAKVSLAELDAEGVLDIEDLLGHYADELRATDQDEEAERDARARRRRRPSTS